MLLWLLPFSFAVEEGLAAAAFEAFKSRSTFPGGGPGNAIWKLVPLKSQGVTPDMCFDSGCYFFNLADKVAVSVIF